MKKVEILMKIQGINWMQGKTKQLITNIIKISIAGCKKALYSKLLYNAS
ncbi:hypothetical protein [Acetivibrio mesophilus]|nr:hypothetical protein [Acetivibrio mesophilus]